MLVISFHCKIVMFVFSKMSVAAVIVLYIDHSPLNIGISIHLSNVDAVIQ